MTASTAPTNTLIAAIRNGNLQLQLPQTLQLQSGESLHCEQLLRLMPGKRGVFKARYRDQPILAKIFLDSAARQITREIVGHERLIAAGQPTPKLIARENFDSGTVLLFEFLSDAQPLFREDAEPNATELNILLNRLQSMYSAGIYHDDLHWGNFLQQNSTAFVIDAGAVLGEPAHPLTSAQVVDNLGLLVAQFQRCYQEIVLHTIREHALFQQFQLTPDSLIKSAENHWRRRKQALLEKCFRNTTATSVVRLFNQSLAYRRAYAGPDLIALLRHPDKVMARGQALKLGNSSTVTKLTLDGRAVVIKRYNMKNIWHWLRRCLRPSRAWTSWRNAHRLELLGLHTPAPIAYLEMRCGFLRRRAYYVCEFVDGDMLAKLLSQREPEPSELAELEKYFTVAASEHLIHGDMKATNFLLTDGKLSILDLDAMREVDNAQRWREQFQRDLARFERNIFSLNTAWLAQLRDHVKKLVGNRS